MKPDGTELLLDNHPLRLPTQRAAPPPEATTISSSRAYSGGSQASVEWESSWYPLSRRVPLEKWDNKWNADTCQTTSLSTSNTPQAFAFAPGWCYHDRFDVYADGIEDSVSMPLLHPAWIQRWSKISQRCMDISASPRSELVAFPMWKHFKTYKLFIQTYHIIFNNYKGTCG